MSNWLQAVLLCLRPFPRFVMMHPTQWTTWLVTWQVTQEKERGLGNDAKYASRDYPG